MRPPVYILPIGYSKRQQYRQYEIAGPDGVATLDQTGNVPVSQLANVPTSVYVIKINGVHDGG